MRSLISLFIILATALSLRAQTPSLVEAFDIRAEIAAPLEQLHTPDGLIVTIPITGGTATGRLTGRIVPGGADRQIVEIDHGRAELNAVYDIMTPDSVVIHVVNRGISLFGEREPYFITSPVFDCPADSPYGWLRDRIFVCRPVEFGDGFITLRVWEVK